MRRLTKHFGASGAWRVIAGSAGPAAVYFALVFAAGVVLGTIRTLLLLPRVGETAAVLIELPVMLVISWVSAGLVIRRFDVPARLADRAVIGAGAFALLMVAEFALSVLAFGRAPAAHFAHYLAPAGALGLAGQVGFALMPVLHPRR